jgi:hypothetical protein
MIVLEEPPKDPVRFAEAVRAVTRATGGVALDQDGFPWPDS